MAMLFASGLILLVSGQFYPVDAWVETWLEAR